MRTLIACVGYRFLRDQSVGPNLLPRLEGMEWPEGVEVLDLHFGPIHAVHWLEEQRFERIVFLAGVERGRTPGEIFCERWQGILPAPEEIQARVAEAVTGIIDLDHLLILTHYFGVLPDDVLVVEIEPEDTGWGPGLSPTVEAALDDLVATVQRAALEGWHG